MPGGQGPVPPAETGLTRDPFAAPVTDNPVLGGLRLALLIGVAAAALAVLVSGLWVQALALLGVLVLIEGVVAGVSMLKAPGESEVPA